MTLSASQLAALMVDRRREVEEHAFRFFQAERDYPNLDHCGAKPSILSGFFVEMRMDELRREFERKS